MNKINLNSFIYNEQITREDLLSVLKQEDIYSFYIGENIKSGDIINSPFREDNIPSFGFFYHKSGNGILMYNDLATKNCGDFVVFVCKLFNLDYKSALFKICYDFGLSNVEITPEHRNTINKEKIKEVKQVDLKIKSRKWKIYDKKFWNQFGIKKSTLNKYDVFPISYIFFNENIRKADKYSYAYKEIKDNKVSFKIYQPYSEKNKWFNNADFSVHQGYRQLPKKGDLLIITKSLKDVMSIHDVISIPTVALQSESVMIKNKVMEEYKERFKTVICLFDNDDPGKEFSEKFSKKYNILEIFIPNYEGVKDFSDLVKVVGKKKARVVFNRILNKKLNNEIKK